MKHWAKADSSSLSSPDGWQRSYAFLILLTYCKKYVLNDTFLVFFPSLLVELKLSADENTYSAACANSNILMYLCRQIYKN